LFLAGLERVPDLVTMAGVPRSATARSLLQRALDISLDMLSPAEVESLRPLAYRHLAARNVAPPMVLKAHDCFRDTPAGEPLFPPEASAGCLHLVRDPRDVCLSLAAHNSITLDRAIGVMGASDFPLVSGAGTGTISEIRAGWSRHTLSWLEAPLRTLMIRYEDLLMQPATSFAVITRFCGLDVSAQAIDESIRRTSFDRLAEQESARGFLERPSTMSGFFRVGRAGQWRSVLSPAQVKRIERDHGNVMERLGYLG